jgi:hypothetical protein
MDYETIKEALAPCGLSCEKCFAHQNGDIRLYSLKLKESLGNFDGYAKRFETMLDKPIFKNYLEFKEMLDYLASENCQGCRNEQCRLFKNCGVRGCQQEKLVDFCFQCDEFPCSRTNFDERLYKIWVLINEKMKKIGLEKYYEETVSRPRYV